MLQRVTDAPRLPGTAELSEFSVFGFDQLLGQMDRQLAQVELRGGEPAVSIVEGAVYVPGEQSGLKRGRRGQSADSFLAPPTVAPQRELDEEVIYLGWLFNHYRHFLMQSLARTWFLSESDPTSRVVFHAAGRGGGQVPPWALRMLDAFGVPRERILTLDAPTRVRRLIIPEPLFEPRAIAQDHAVRAHVAMARPYQAVAARLAGDATPSDQPLYLSRRLLPPSQRTIVGEAELEAVLRENGFRIAYPETMPFEDQVRLVNEHSDIFSNAGSAAHNVLFARHQPRLHLLTNGTKFSPDYFLYATVSGAATTFINCLSAGERPSYERGSKQTPHLLDMPAIGEYVAGRGFLRARLPTRSPEHEAALRTRYDEDWFGGYIRALGRRQTLPADLEEEALRLAAASWPLSLLLVHYYAARRDHTRANRLATQFVALVEAEGDRERLARYRNEVRAMAPILIKRRDPETAAALARVIAERFSDAARRETAP